MSTQNFDFKLDVFPPADEKGWPGIDGTFPDGRDFSLVIFGDENEKLGIRAHTPEAALEYAAELAHRWNAHNDLVEACKKAEAVLERSACGDNDINHRQDAREALQIIRQSLTERSGQ